MQMPQPDATPSELGANAMLQGLVVLDFTRVLAGPHCTRTLADLGARIIKIERPGEGDEMRRAPAKLPGDGDQSSYFARRNAGKQSVAIDLSQPAGQTLVQRLVSHCDVAIENFAPGVADKLGIGFETLSSIKRDLIYCSISGYGQTGPLSRRGAFAHVVSAASGVMYLDAGETGPRTSHLQAADVLAGSNAVGAILAALWRRSTTGQGAHIDVSMLESLIAGEDVSYAAVPNGEAAIPGPRSGMGISPVGDRWVAWQTGGAPQLWPRLCTAMKRPELIADPRFATAVSRREHWDTIQETVTLWLQSYAGADEALEALAAARLPSAMVLTPEEVVEHPQLRQREAFTSIPHGGGGSVRVTSSPYWIDDAPVLPSGPAPYHIGHHTREVLTEMLGMDETQLQVLVDQGTVVTPA
ncbi:MAG: CoA transferase [Chromatiales bacterium]|jgi:CoA:oxalate CoA-transferase|nr:CoA transferase [Chromatiales bacterium]